MNEKVDLKMKPLKVLMVIPYLPDQSNVVTLVAKRILESLQKKCEAKIIWILQTTCQQFDNKFENITIKPIQQYNDACDLIDKEKPDVIFAEFSFDYSSYPFIIAGRYKKIPVVCYSLYGYDYRLTSPISRTEIIRSKISRFFSRNTHDDLNKPFGKGLFYLYKYFFFLRTLRATGMKSLDFISAVLDSIWVNSFGIFNKKFDSRLACDAICLANDSWLAPLLNEGYAKDMLHVTGSPLFDEYSITSISPKQHPAFPLKVLLVTSPMNTHGIWSNNRQRNMIENIISEMKKNSTKIKLAIKIHPTSENISFYQEILNEMNLDIELYQKEKLPELLKNYDSVISFGIVSGSTFEILYSGLPFVMINMFTDIKSYPFIEQKLAMECTSISKLIVSLEQALKNNPSREDLENYFYTFSKPLDGRASDRVSDIIISTAKMDDGRIPTPTD